MKQTTKCVLGVTVASILVIGAATGVFARGGYGPGWGGHYGMMGGPGGPFGGRGMMMRGDPVAGADQRLTALKSNLGITVEQEQAWSAYVEALKAKAGMMVAHRKTLIGSGIIDPEQRLAFRQEGLTQIQKLTAATRELYAVLSPEQQAKAGNLAGTRFGPRCVRQGSY